MAKPSLMKTPKKPRVAAEERRVEDDVSASDNDGEAEAEAAGNDASFAPAENEDLRAAGEEDRQFRPAPMGAEQSRELNAAVHATAEELQARTGHRISNGKLKRPSTGRLNPPYKNSATATQRHIRGPHQVRPDTYDLEISPEKSARPARSRQLEGQGAFSPLKKQGKGKKAEARRSLAEYQAADQQQIDEQLNGVIIDQPEAIEPYSSPRRSTRQAKAREQEQAQDDEDASLLSLTQHTRYRDYFPDPIVQRALQGEEADAVEDEQPKEDASRYVEAEVEATPGAPAEGADEAINVAQSSTPAREPRTARRGRPRKSRPGRPKKQATTSNATPAASSSMRSERQIAARTPVLARPELAEEEALDSVPTTGKQSSTRATRTGQAVQRKKAEAAAEAAAVQTRIYTAQEQDKDYVDDGQAAVGAEEEDDHEEEAEEGEPDLPTRPVPREVARLRESDLFGPGASKHTGLSSPEKQPSPQKRKRRANDEENRPAVNSSRKRQRTETPAAAIDEEEDEPESVDVARRIYGQWRALRKVFKAVDNIGVHVNTTRRGDITRTKRKFGLEDEDVREVVDLCDIILETIEGDDDPAADLSEASKLVDALHRETEDSEPDFNNGRRAKDVYAHVFAKLLDVLKALIVTYEEADNGKVAANTLTMGHLKIVTNWIKLIVDLGAGAKDYDRKALEGMSLVKAVENGIYVPLRPIYSHFQKIISNHYRREQYEATQRHIAEQQEHDDEEYERERRRKDQIKEIKKKWAGLHMTRIAVEGFAPPAKQRHLQQPNLQYLPSSTRATELDANGEPFERIEVFSTRLGPPPALVQAAKEVDWKMVELNALADGLRTHKGEHVYQRIFYEYCSKGGLLRRFNVTEIVTKAAELKEWLTDQRMEKQGWVDEWVKEIPVWTRGLGVGKENRQAVEADGDVELDGEQVVGDGTAVGAEDGDDVGIDVDER